MVVLLVEGGEMEATATGLRLLRLIVVMLRLSTRTLVEELKRTVETDAIRPAFAARIGGSENDLHEIGLVRGLGDEIERLGHGDKIVVRVAEPRPSLCL